MNKNPEFKISNTHVIDVCKGTCWHNRDWANIPHYHYKKDVYAASPRQVIAGAVEIAEFEMHIT